MLLLCSAATVVYADETAVGVAGAKSVPAIKDVVNKGEKVDTYNVMFYMPDEWRSEYNDYYDGNSLDSCALGVWWMAGDYGNSEYPGYAVTEKVDNNPNIFKAELPSNARTIIWNNLVRTSGSDDLKMHDSYLTSELNSLYGYDAKDEYDDDKNEDIFGFYPDGLKNFDGMIFVCNTVWEQSSFSGPIVYKGAWFYYYGNGEYGIYKTRAEAKEKGGVYSGGKFPSNEENPQETTEPVTSVTEKKSPNPMTVSVKSKTVKAKKLKKKAQKVKAITVKKAKGAVSFKITKAAKIKKYLKIDSKGVITFAKWKKAKKGTYNIKVQINAKGNANYKTKTVVKTLKIKVK